MTRTRSGFEFLKNCLGNADPELFARGPCTWLFFCDMFTEISPAPGLGLNSQKSAEECVSRVILFWNPCAQSKFFFTWLYKKYLKALQTLFVYSKRKTDMLNTEQKMYLSWFIQDNVIEICLQLYQLLYVHRLYVGRTSVWHHLPYGIVKNVGFGLYSTP